MQTSSQREPWQEALRLMNRCPICGEPYPSEGVKFFLRKKNSSVVHSTCANCKSSFVATILMLGKGVSSVGMVTDLNFFDVERLYGKEPITLDEVIAGYEFLKEENWVKFS